MSLVDQVMAAKAAAEAKYAGQTSIGTPLSEEQKAEILIAQVQAIIAGEVIAPAPAPETKAE